MAEASAPAAPQMAIEVECERAQRAPQESHGPVGQATRAAALDLVGPAKQHSRRVSGTAAACKSGSALGQ